MKKTKTVRLQLSRETIGDLRQEDLQQVDGGRGLVCGVVSALISCNSCMPLCLNY